MSRSNLALRLPDGAPFAANERVALDNILGRASGEQRAWLAGFLAGIATRDRRRAAEAQPAVQAAEPLLILYATESGNAEAVAAKLASSARRQGFKVTLKDVADSDPTEAAKSQEPAAGRCHLGRGGAAVARCRLLSRAHGGGCPVFSAGAVCRAGPG